jgi:hypothetical protein
VTIPFRSELRPFLDEFVEAHRGARLGTMFGLPALYAGRRLFACLIEDGIIVRLPADIARREIRNGATPFSGPSTRPSRARSAQGKRRRGSWMMYRPRSIVAARRLVPVLELAAREIARQQVEEMTGVRLR